MAKVTLLRGDDHVYRWTFRKLDDSILDLSGVTVWFTVKATAPVASDEDLDDALAKIKYWWAHDGSVVTGSDGIALPSGGTVGDGVLEVTFPHALTTTLPKVELWNYDLQLKLPNDKIRTWDSGQFAVTLDITRRTVTP